MKYVLKEENLFFKKYISSDENNAKIHSKRNESSAN